MAGRWARRETAFWAWFKIRVTPLRTIVKKTTGGFHNGPDAEVFGSQCFATRQATIVKKMCDTPSTFHNAQDARRNCVFLKPKHESNIEFAPHIKKWIGDFISYSNH